VRHFIVIPGIKLLTVKGLLTVGLILLLY
jgi:hypothetical protein